MQQILEHSCFCNVDNRIDVYSGFTHATLGSRLKFTYILLNAAAMPVLQYPYWA